MIRVNLFPSFETARYKPTLITYPAQLTKWGIYQTDSCVRQQRIEGFDSKIVRIWFVGCRKNTYNVIQGRAGKTFYLLDVWRLFK